MKQSIRIITNNAFTILVIVVFVIVMFVLSHFKALYWDNNNVAEYGGRLEGSEVYKPTSDELKEVEQKILEDVDVEKVDIEIQGRIINIHATVKDTLKVANAKIMGKEWLAFFTEDVKTYYSIQFFIVKEDTSKTDYPIIGYKHYEKTSISWTKDR